MRENGNSIPQYTYRTSAEYIATVDDKGVITGVGKGELEISGMDNIKVKFKGDTEIKGQEQSDRRANSALFILQQNVRRRYSSGHCLYCGEMIDF